MSLRRTTRVTTNVSIENQPLVHLDQVLQLGQNHARNVNNVGDIGGKYKRIQTVKSISGYYAWPPDPALYANVMTVFQEAMDSIANADAYLNDTGTTHPRNILEEVIFKLCRSLQNVHPLFADIQHYSDATIMYNDLLEKLRNRLFLFSNKISTWQVDNPNISYEDLISKCNLLMNPPGPVLRRNFAVIPNSQPSQPPGLQRQNAMKQ